ncbi:unnamed protein product [Amoebophrya sp. A120]|nr:unnamed protein product [Amoebophrya sp. A120]|eukprot:GSA120T00001840001.1
MSALVSAQPETPRPITGREIRREAVENCLQAVRNQTQRRTDEGLSAHNFFVGVANVILVTYVFGAHPEHFWILYAFECLYLFPKRYSRPSFVLRLSISCGGADRPSAAIEHPRMSASICEELESCQARSISRNGVVLLYSLYKHIRWTRAKALGCQLYWLDYCWFVNFVGQGCLVVFFADALLRYTYQQHQSSRDMVDVMWSGAPETGLSALLASYGYERSRLSPEVRRLVFGTFFATSTGPLLGSVIALQNALVFHSLDNMINVLIHLFPPLLFYTLKFKTQRILDVYPGVFNLHYIDELDVVTDVVLPGVALYWAWWLFYAPWLLTVGKELPNRSKAQIAEAAKRLQERMKSSKQPAQCSPGPEYYDTVFHAIMRGSGPIVGTVDGVLGIRGEEKRQRQQANSFSRAQIMGYMCTHAFAAHIGFLLSIPLWYSRDFFRAMLVASVSSAIWHAASRYNHQLGKAYEKVVLAELQKIDEPAKTPEQS